jgi:tetratricopeptide (TPR) repeat protein
VVTGHGAFSSLDQQSAEFIDIAPLERDMAVELLRGFAGDRIDAEPGALDSILALCTGLPIALCLVGRMLAEDAGLSLAELLEELSDPDVGITQVVLGDEPSLAAVFEAGYRRLSEPARRCYRAIGLAPNGPDISVGVLGAALGLPAHRIRAVVRELTLMRIAEETERGRLVVHNLVREHAHNVARVVETSTERRTVQGLILNWYAANAIAADYKLSPLRGWWQEIFPGLVMGTAPDNYRKWMETERANLRSAVTLAFELGFLDVVIHLCVALWSLYEPGKFYDDLLATHELGLRAAEGTAPVTALLLVQKAFGLSHRGHHDEAIECCRTAAAIAGNIKLVATATETAGLMELARQNREAALTLLRRNLELAIEIGDPRRTALARLHLAKALEPDEALSQLALAMVAFQEINDSRNAGKVFTWQGRKLKDLGNLEAAKVRLTEALTLMADWKFDRAQILDELGDIAARQGDNTQAKEHFEQALDIYGAGGHLTNVSVTRKRLQSLTG